MRAPLSSPGPAMTVSSTLRGASAMRWPWLAGSLALHLLLAALVLGLADRSRLAEPPPPPALEIDLVDAPPATDAADPLPSPPAPAAPLPLAALPDPTPVPAPMVVASAPSLPIPLPLAEPPPPLSAPPPATEPPPPPPTVVAAVPPPPPLSLPPAEPPPPPAEPPPPATEPPPTPVAPPPDTTPPPRPVATPSPRPAPKRPVPRPQERRATPSTSASQQASAAPIAAPPAEPAAPAAPQADWDHLVSAWLAAHRSYPEPARRRGETGEVTLRFAVAADGQVTEVTVLSATGAHELTEAAVALLSRATLPPPQVAVTRTIRIRYRLED
jgi:protein TonB